MSSPFKSHFWLFFKFLSFQYHTVYQQNLIWHLHNFVFGNNSQSIKNLKQVLSLNIIFLYNSPKLLI